jgi:ribosomal protein S18 acetylase RimI-like enzyme
MQREVSGQLRPLDLRRDFEGISKLVETAFAEDLQRTGLQFREELKVFRRLVPWALLLGRFNKFFRELLGGYVWEDHGQIVGSVVMQPRGPVRRKWNISAVATHPDYRRRGIARRLMEAAIEHIRERGGELALLAVYSDNTPAYQLYLGLGFTHFDSVTLLRLDGIPDVEFKPIEGYVVRPMSPGEWRTRYELAKEAVPAEVQAFNPLSEREFRVGPWMRLLQTFSHFLERVEVHIWAAEALLTKALGSLKNYPGRGVLARVWSSRTALLELFKRYGFVEVSTLHGMGLELKEGDHGSTKA